MDKKVISTTDIEKKIQKTRQETQRLQLELQNLIDFNIKQPEPTVVLTDDVLSKGPENQPKLVTENVNKVQILRSHDRQAVGSKKNENEGLISPKKPKAYDVQQAREFIRKQKEKRLEELKNKKKVSSVTADMKKEKLKELQKKSLELVAKNVKMKRERSKSRDPPNIRSRSASRDRPINLNNAIIASTTRSRSADNRKIPEKISPVNADIDKISARYLSSELPTSSENVNSKSRESRSKKNPHLLYPPEPSYGHKSENSVNNIENNMHIIDLQPNNILSVEQNHSTHSNNVQNLKLVKETIPVPVSEIKTNRVNIISDIMVKPGTYSAWLQDSSPQTDPFNLINTVNRQLKYVTEITKNNLVDVGIQNSMSKEKSSKKSEIKNHISEHSGSDTSKNIPSIVSESNCKVTEIPSEHFNHERHIHSNIMNLEAPNIRLNSSNKEKPSTVTSAAYSINFTEETKKSHSNINSIRKNLFVDEDLYDVERLNKSRESIIAFNRASPTVSPNISPHIQKITDKQINKDIIGFQNKHIKKASVSNSSKIPEPQIHSSSQSIISTLDTAFQKSTSLSSDVSTLNNDIKPSEEEYLSLFSNLRVSNENSSQQNLSRKSNTLNGIPELTVPNTKIDIKQIPEILKSESSIEDILSDTRKFSEDVLCSSSKTSQTSNKSIKLSNGQKSGKEISESSKKSAKEIFKSKMRKDEDFNGQKSDERLSESSSKSIKEILKAKIQDSETSLEEILSEYSKSNKTTSQVSTAKSERHFSQTTSKKLASNSEQNILQNGSHNVEKEPKLTLKMSEKKKFLDRNSLMKNISIRPNSSTEKSALINNISVRSSDKSRGDMNTTQNEIHLKFEAEIHLLNDFNQSLQHFSEIEKEYQSLRSKNDSERIAKKALQDRDTQTSKVGSNSLDIESNASRSQLSFINFSRGSGTNKFNFDLTINEDITDNPSDIESLLIPSESVKDSTISSVVSVKENSMGRYSKNGMKNSDRRNLDDVENRNLNNVALMMLDTMITEEDARLENLKFNLSIKKQVLLERTKVELFTLEVQKKKLQKNLKLEEASEVKKKQRGILLRLQQEQHEIQRLKQMQNEATQKRKNDIKQQKNLIKNQLYTDQMLSKLKLLKHRERRRSTEPMKVIQTTRTVSESIHSETSLVERQTGVVSDNEIRTLSTTRTQSTSNILSEISDNNTPTESGLLDFKNRDPTSVVAIRDLQKTLLMRQQALAKRRKATEELLQWHKKLVEEEKAIVSLEETARNLVFQTPSDTNLLKNRRITNLKRNLSENDVKTISQDIVFDRISSSLKAFSSHTSTIPSQGSLTDPASNNNYTTDFEPESPAENVDNNKISSISQLIDDFSKIHEEISTIHTEKSLEEIEAQTVEVETANESTEQKYSSHTDTLGTQVINSEKDVQISSQIEESKPSDENTKITEEMSTENDNEQPKSLTEIIQSLKSTLKSEKITEDDDFFSENKIQSEPTLSEPQVIELSEINNAVDISSNIASEVKQVSEILSVPKVQNEGLEQTEVSSETNNNKTVYESSEIELSEIVSEIDKTLSKILENEDVKELQEETIPSLEELNLDLQETQNSSVSSQEQDSGTSKQIEDLSEDLVSPLSKEARTSFIDEKEHDSMSSESASESHKIKSVVAVEEKSLENKTDEEKAASIRNSNHNEPEPRRFTLSEEYAAQLNASNSSSSNNNNINVPSLNKNDKSSTSSNSDSTINEEKSVISTEKSHEKSTVSTESGYPDRSTKSSDSVEKSPKSLDLTSKSPKKSLKTCSTEARSPRLLEDRSPRGNIDVKKRVLEILSEASPVSSREKSPRMQDMCIMTYDLASPLGSPEAGPSKESLGNEAQELLRKQLAIEQEIKLLTAQQQKESTSPTYVREIPNKPPPPYKPPTTKSPKKTVVESVIPKSKEIEEIATYSAKIIHKAYLTNNLENISISDNTLSLIAKDINKDCYKFVFDLCKEIAIDHYGQFKKEQGPCWLNLETSNLSNSAPLNVQGLEKMLKQKLMENFGYQKPSVRHSSIISWSQKKLKDKVDAVVIQEMYNEESSWNHFEKEEILMKNRVVNQVFDKLFDEALSDFVRAIQARYFDSR